MKETENTLWARAKGWIMGIAVLAISIHAVVSMTVTWGGLYMMGHHVFTTEEERQMIDNQRDEMGKAFEKEYERRMAEKESR